MCRSINGFSNVSGLRKDDSGVWRGKAMKDGKSIDVILVQRNLGPPVAGSCECLIERGRDVGGAPHEAIAKAR
jgi:hypothetical protein